MSYKVEEVKRKAMETAANIHMALSVLYALVVVFSLFAWFKSYSSHDASTMNGAIMPLLVSIPLFVHFSAAKGLRKNKPWARPVSIIIGILLLFGFPLGTILGFIILNQMLKKEWAYNDDTPINN